MVEKEVDKDLTMLKPPTDPVQESFDAMMKDPSTVNTLRKKAPATKQAYDKRMSDFAASQITRNLESEGAVDIDLDANQGFGTTLETRARNQSEAIKGIKAIGGGIYTGALIALEQIGYVGDLDTYTNMFSVTEDFSGNAWTRLMRDAQEAARESDMFKIYEDEADPNSVMSQIFKWTSLEGAVSSSVGFGLPGLGAARLVSYLGSLGKFKQLAQLTDIAMGNITGKSMMGATNAFVGPLASSMMSNYFMGQMMAVDTYQQSMEALTDVIGSGEVSELDAQKIAANNAQEVVGLNMALTSTAFLRFGNIFKRSKNLAAKVKNPSAMSHMKEMIVKGAPTAFVENIYQEMIQMEQIYDTKSDLGVAVDYSSDYWDRMSQLALSNRALHAGALGIAGGPIQFAIIQKPLMRKQFAQQKVEFDRQEEVLTYNKGLIENQLKHFTEWESAINKSIVKGDLTSAEFGSDLAMFDEITKALEWGKIDFLRKDMQDIMNWTPEQAAKEGYQENYKDIAESLLTTINHAEMHYSEHSGKENAGAITFNRVAKDRTQIERFKIKAERDTIFNKLTEELKLYPELDGIELTRKFNIKRDKGRMDSLSEKDTLALMQTETRQDKILDSVLENNSDITKLKKLDDKADKVGKLAKDLDDQFDEITSDDYQRKYKKGQDKKLNDYEGTVNKATADFRSKDQAKKENTYRTMSNVLVDAKDEAVADRDKRLKGYDEQISGLSTINRNTFTSYDATGKTRIYSPGDLMRSVDGRYFKVERQNKSIQAKGNLTASLMPLLYEVNEKGNKIVSQDSRLFLLDTHDFLRKEVRQAYYTKDGSARLHKDTPWAPYEASDSLRRPNNYSSVYREERRAADGKAISVNGFEYENNTAEIHVPTKMAKEYNLESLNKPLFPGQEYEITLKRNPANRSIDVYRGKVKLTYLDRHSNINYELIDKALAQGEVTGTVVAHYSSSSNFVKTLDADGKVIRSSIADMKKLPNNLLPNNKIYIIQTPGNSKYSSRYEAVAMDENGRVYKDGIIDVDDGTGKMVPTVIPFDGRVVGDTYALMTSSTGSFIPIALATSKLGMTPSNIRRANKNSTNETLVDDVVEMLEEIKRDVYSDITQDEDAFNKKIRDDQEKSGRVLSDMDKAIAVRKEKQDFVGSHYTQLNDALEKTVYEVFRPDTRRDAILTKKNGTSTIDKEGGVALVNPTHFSISFGVDDSNMLSPVIKIPKGKKSFEYVNLSDEPKKFRILLGTRMRKMSILSMMEGGQKAANDMIFSGDLTTDIDLSKGRAGSSLTIELHGEDFKTDGAALAIKVKSSWEKIAAGLFSKAKESDIETISETLNEFISMSSEDITGLKQIAEDGDKAIYKSVTHLFNTLGIKNYVVEVGKAKKFFEAAEIPTEYESSYQKALNLISEHVAEENRDAVARVYTYISVFDKDLVAGDIEVAVKTNSLDAEKPIQYVQPEGMAFRRGDTVYSAKDGYTGKIYKVHRKGTAEWYWIKKEGSNMPSKIYPNYTFLPNGEYASLYKDRATLTSLTKDSPRFKILQDAIIAAENKLYYVKDNKSLEDAETIITTDVSAYSIDDYVTSVLRGKHKAKITHINSLSTTDRTEEYKHGINELMNLSAKFDVGIEGPTDPKILEKVTDDQVELALKTMKASIPYTDNQINDLIETATDPNMVATLQDFLDYKKLLDATMPTDEAHMSLIKVYSQVTKKLNAQNIAVPGLVWNAETSTKYNDEFGGDMQMMDLQSEAIESLAARITDVFYIETQVNEFTTRDTEVPTKVEPKFEDKTEEVEATSEPKELVAKVVTKPKTVKIKGKVNHRDAIINPDYTTVQMMKDLYMFTEETMEDLFTADVSLKDKKSVVSNLAEAAGAGLASSDLVIQELNRIGVYKNVETREEFNEKKVGDSIIYIDLVHLGVSREYARYISVNGNPNDVSVIKMKIAGETDIYTINKIVDVYINSIYGEKSRRKYSREDITKNTLVDAGINEIDADTIAVQVKDKTILNKLINEVSELYFETEIKSVVNKFFNDNNLAPFKLGDKVKNTPEKFKAEVLAISKLLPQVPIEVVENVAAMYKKFGAKAIGAYDRGVRYLVNNANEGTAYHETFHAVSDLFLSPAQKAEIAKENGFTKWSIKVDEKLAAKFETYMKDRSTFADRVFAATRKFFNSIINWVKGTRSADVTESLFEKIAEGGFASSKSEQFLSTMQNYKMGMDSVERFKLQLSDKNNVTLQGLMDSKKIKIIC